MNSNAYVRWHRKKQSKPRIQLAKSTSSLSFRLIGHTQFKFGNTKTITTEWQCSLDLIEWTKYVQFVEIFGLISVIKIFQGNLIRFFFAFSHLNYAEMLWQMSGSERLVLTFSFIRWVGFQPFAHTHTQTHENSNNFDVSCSHDCWLYL